jgi:hypothetical protein
MGNVREKTSQKRTVPTVMIRPVRAVHTPYFARNKIC